METRGLARMLLERTRAARVVDLEPLVQPLPCRFGVDPEPSQICRRGTRAVQPEDGTNHELLLAIAESRGNAADGLARPGDLFIVATVVASAGHAAYVRHEIAVAFVSAGRCQVVAGVGREERHQGVHERGLAATRRPDDGGTLQVDLGGVPTGERAPVEELEMRDDE